MARSSFLFTSESVSEGHPDKVADRISDTVVDLFLAKDPEARVACETLTTTNRVVLAGEIRGKGIWEDGGWAPGVEAEIEAAVRAAVKDIGYEQDGFHWRTFEFSNHLHGQSVDIAVGVDSTDTKDEGAGDQGIMFGYASNETPELMPFPIYYSHRLVERQSQLRRDGRLPWLRPDAKSQVTVRYVDGRPHSVDTVVLSTQHSPDISQAQIREAVIEEIIKPVLPADMLKDTKYLVNPTGRFVIGGPQGDCGLTGRKIIVDSYGGMARHGGGAFSGKDPSKVDRSAAYAARYVAKNIVAAGLADRCTIQISYAIGVAKPQSIHVDLHGTGKISEAVLEDKILDLIGGATPRAIRQHLGLNKPIYAKTSSYGHFGRKPGRDGSFSWERTDLAKSLKQALAA